VHVGRGLLSRLPRLLASRAPGRRAVVITDARLARSLGARVARSLRAAGWRVDAAALPQGERAKSLAALVHLYGFLIDRRTERRTPLVAVGGGTVGDAAGFAAATYFRGIPLVHVPTTLLAQVDSAIGGKTAVNHPLVKNAIGAFYQPVLVVADIDALASLPQPELAAGMAEVVKYALVFDRSFARWLDSRWRQAVELRQTAALTRLVRHCVRLKAAAAADDEKDLFGRRELLNFGHTFGHALEAATGYRRFRHGEAVAWGMRVAVELSKGRGWLAERSERTLVEALLRRLPSPSWPRSLRQGALLAGLAGDKKVAGARNVFILLRGLGRPVRVRDVSRRELLSAIARTLKQARRP
jgi:3-dehydroquinate synthase